MFSKSLREVVEKSRENDTVQISGSFVLKEGIGIDHSLILDGQNKTVLKLTPEIATFVVSGGNRLTFKNMKLLIPAKCNIAWFQSFSGMVILDKVSIDYDRKCDPRDIYSPFACDHPENIRFELNEVKAPYLFLNALEITADRCQIGNLFTQTSVLQTNQLNIKDNTLTNIVCRSFYQDQSGRLQGEHIDTEGYLSIENMDGMIQNLTMKRLPENEWKLFVDKNQKEKPWQKLFRDESFIQSMISYLQFKHVGRGSDLFLIKSLRMDAAIDPMLPDLQSLVVFDSQLAMEDSVIPFTSLCNQVRDSSLRFESVDDKSEWVSEGLTLSQKNSSSSLMDDGGVKGAKVQEDAMSALKSMTGLANVKTHIDNMVSTAAINAERKRRGIKSNDGFSLHMVFAGSPGTGKTTVAKLFGRALYEHGVMETDKFVVASRKDLVATHVGETAPQTHELVMSALGGVLFIDEAYTLKAQGESDFAEEAVAQLIADMEDHRDSLVVILAGYTEDMQDFFRTGNAGLRSRFTNWIEFPDYSLQELAIILLSSLKAQGVLYDQQTYQYLGQQYELVLRMELQRNNGKIDGNARFVRNYVERLLTARDVRIAKMGSYSDTDLVTLKMEDITHVTGLYQNMAY